MRLLSLKEIAAMEPGEIVPGLRCQIKTVGKVNEGDNDYGHWTIQKMTVLDSTGILNLKLFNQQIFDGQWQGLWIVCQSTPGKGGKLGGLIVVDDEYGGRVQKQVHLKDGALIEQVTDATPEPAAAVRQAAQPVRAPETAKTSPMPVQGANKGDSVALAKQKLGQQVNAMKLSYDAALYLAETVLKAHPEVTIPMFTPDILQKIAVSFSIALDRSGLVMGLPSGPLQKAKAPEPPPPPEPDELPDDVQF